MEREVFLTESRIQLTTKEYDILKLLVCSPGQVFSYSQIYEKVWEEDYSYEKNIIMSHIRHLRKKIEPDLTHPRYIENVRGVGYRFKKQ